MTTDAYVDDSTNSHAIAEGPRSQAEIWFSNGVTVDAVNGESKIVGLQEHGGPGGRGGARHRSALGARR